MTTIVWDGKTLAADSRLTYMKKLVHGTFLPGATTYDVQKIIVPSSDLTINGEPVQAYACSGDMAVPTFIKEHLNKGPVELSAIFHNSELCVFVESQAIVITEEHAYSFNFLPLIVTWDAYSRETPLAIGSGHVAFTSVEATWACDNAVELVAVASRSDYLTGGNINCWTAASGLNVAKVVHFPRLQSFMKWAESASSLKNWKGVWTICKEAYETAKNDSFAKRVAKELGKTKK